MRSCVKKDSELKDKENADDDNIATEIGEGDVDDKGEEIQT